MSTDATVKPPATTSVFRTQAAVAGAVAAGISVATVETPHLFTSALSLVLAIADQERHRLRARH